MNKNIFILGIMLLLMISVASAESNLVHHWTFENSDDDLIGNADLDSEPLTYVSGSIQTSEGVEISNGGFTPTSSGFAKTATSEIELDLNSAWTVAIWYNHNQTWVGREDLLVLDYGVSELTIAYEDTTFNGGIDCNINANGTTRVSVMWRQDTAPNYPEDNTLALITCIVPNGIDSATGLTGFLNGDVATSGTSINPGTVADVISFGGVSTLHNTNIVFYSIKMYDKALNQTDYDNLLLYDDIDGESTPNHNYSISTTQTPVNITIETIGDLVINASVSDSIGNFTDLNDSNATINITLTQTGNNNCTFIYAYNNSCIDFSGVKSMDKINNSYFSFSTDESYYFPAYYPYDEQWLEEVVKDDYELVNQNVFKFEIKNLTTNHDTAVFVEYNIDYFSLVKEDPLFVMFCYHNYTSGVPITSDVCFEIDRLPVGTDFNHCHTTNSCHHVSKIPPDYIQDNNNSSAYIIFGSTASVNQAKWLARYSENSTYASGTTIFELSNDQGVSWSSSEYIFDVHLHQFATDDNINYSVTFDNGDSTTETSSSIVDYFDIINSPPNHVIILSPTEEIITLNSTGVDILFNWTDSTDPDEDSITYTLQLSNGLTQTTLATGLSDSNYTKQYTNTELLNQDYSIYVTAIDSYGASAETISIDPFTICINNWVATEQICIENIANNTYSDSNSCPIEYDKPDSYLTNCSYEEVNTLNTLLILWGILAGLMMFLITRGVNMGWFGLATIFMLFIIFSYNDISDDSNLKIIFIIVAMILYAVSIFKFTFADIKE